MAKIIQNLNEELQSLMGTMPSDWTRKELEKHYITKMKAITIPINMTLEGKQKILDMSELENIIKNANVLSQETCYCRERVEKCIEPMDGCIGINDDAVKSIEKYNGKKISADEALKALRRTYEAGLVHLGFIFDGKDKIERICSFCSCCCHSLSAVIRFGYSNHVFSSKFIAAQEESKCSGCGICVDRCKFGARELSNDKLVFHNEKCFGCGLCLETCPKGAISMVEREE